MWKGGCNKVSADIFSQVTSSRVKESLRLHQGRFGLDSREKFYAERVVKHWNKLPRKVKSPSLEDTEFKDIV